MSKDYHDVEEFYKEECSECGLLCNLGEHSVLDCQERQIATLRADRDRQESENKELQERNDTQKALIERLDKRATQVEAREATLREALESIAEWSQESQDRAEECDAGIALWRGCIAAAQNAIDALAASASTLLELRRAARDWQDNECILTAMELSQAIDADRAGKDK